MFFPYLNPTSYLNVTKFRALVSSSVFAVGMSNLTLGFYLVFLIFIMLLWFPVILSSFLLPGLPWIPDAFSILFMSCELNRLSNFALLVTDSSSVFMGQLLFVRKLLLVRNSLTVFQNC